MGHAIHVHRTHEEVLVYNVGHRKPHRVALDRMAMRYSFITRHVTVKNAVCELV